MNSGDDIEVMYDPNRPRDNDLLLNRLDRCFQPVMTGTFIVGGAAMFVAAIALAVSQGHAETNMENTDGGILVDGGACDPVCWSSSGRPQGPPCASVTIIEPGIDSVFSSRDVAA